MELQAVREALHRQPFRPFVICLADGPRLPITRPDSVVVGKRRAFVIGPDDSTSLIEPQMIVALELDEERSSQTNPSGKSGTGDQNRITIEQIRPLYSAVPFEPFVLHLSDGRKISVQRRELMAFSPSGRTIIVYQPDDAFNIIDLSLVTDLESGDGKAPKEPRSYE